MHPLKLARIAPLILVGLCACSLELPGAGGGDSWPDTGLDPVLDAELPDASDELDAATDADEPTAALDAQEDDAQPELDAEPAVMCGTAQLGASEQRTRYAALSVIAPTKCRSELQERTCTESGWSQWSGTFQSEQCSVSSHRSCGAVAHGAQELRTRYITDLSDSASGCESEQQTRTCSDGSFSAWSGTYEFESCAVSAQGECSLEASVPCEDGTSCAARGGQDLSCLGTPGYGCSANEQCVATCVEGECAPESDPGGACEEVADCAGCSTGSVDCVDQLCRCEDGAACGANKECQHTCVADACAPLDARCDDDEDCSDERKCLRKTVVSPHACLLPDGNDCGSNAECQHVCRASECDTVGASGEDCDENADCVPGLVCRTQHCAARASLRQSCDESADCAAGLTCTALQICLKSVGQACTPILLECASGNCSSSGSGSATTCQP